MMQRDQYFRSHQRLRVVHAEAFQLMLYQPRKDEIGPDLWIWNSRDGVTPFGTRRGNLDYTHAMGAYMPSHWGSLPDAATHVWIDYDPYSWEVMQRINYERHSNGAHQGDFLQRFATVDAWLSLSPFEYGQPRLLSREDYLTITPSWMGKCA